RTTTISSAPVPVRPAARSALPAVVPAGTTTREVDAATADDGSDTTYSLDDLRMTANPDPSCRHSAGFPPISPKFHRSNVGPTSTIVYVNTGTSRANPTKWAMLGSNQRPLRCERSALPLS